MDCQCRVNNRMPYEELSHTVVKPTLATGTPPAKANPSVRVRIVETTAEFDALEADWNALLEKSPARVFQTFEWLRTWWEYKATAGDRLHILVFSDGETTVGLAPLMMQTFRVAGLPLCRRLQFIGAGLTDYSDVLIAPGYESAIFASMARYLVEHRHMWDVFDLEDVNEESPLVLRFPDHLRAARLPVYSYQGNVCPWFELPASADDIMSEMSPSSISNFRRKKKKFYNQFGGELKVVTREAEDIANAIEDFSVVHGNRWKSLGFPSAFDDPGMRAFHVSFAQKFARRGWLRLYLLYARGEPVAAHFGFNFRGRIYLYHANVQGSADVMRCSPGLIIRTHVMTDGIQEGMKIFDYLRGDEEYKHREWKTFPSRNYLLRIASPRATSAPRFWFFLLKELWRKTMVRARWEYYGYRRFLITRNPAWPSRVRFIGGRAADLLSLGYDFVYRHSPLRSVSWLRLREGAAEQAKTREKIQAEDPLASAEGETDL